jgi:hypothetical protein
MRRSGSVLSNMVRSNSDILTLLNCDFVFQVCEHVKQVPHVNIFQVYRRRRSNDEKYNAIDA